MKYIFNTTKTILPSTIWWAPWIMHSIDVTTPRRKDKGPLKDRKDST